MNLCEFYQGSNITYHWAGSSPSLIIMYTPPGIDERWVLKCYSVFHGYVYSYGVVYEGRMYSEIVPQLLERSPCFVPPRGLAVCSPEAVEDSTFKDWWESYIAKIARRAIGRVENLDFYVNLYDVPDTEGESYFYIMRKLADKVRDNPALMLESPELFMTGALAIENATSLEELVNSKRYILTNEDCDSILFQILYALLQMQYLRVMHNDLHFLNMLVQELPETVSDTYDVLGKTYRVPVKYRVYIFDWDMAYSEELGPNKKLDEYMCPDLGICNKFTPKRDLYTILCSIITTPVPDYMKQMAARMVPQFSSLRDLENFQCSVNTNKDPALFNSVVPDIIEMITDGLGSAEEWCIM